MLLLFLFGTILNQCHALASHLKLHKITFDVLPRYVPKFSMARFSSVAGTDSTIPSPSPSPSPSSKSLMADLSLMEIRVGKIVEVSIHPDADGLFVEKIDLGETTGPRVIVSGLVQYCSAENLLNRFVVVLCNLKPRAIKGITSNGMVLCSSSADHTQVDPLVVPEGVLPGELVSFEGCAIKYVEPGNKASKAFSKIADEFYADENLVATFQGTPFMTSKGPITSTLKGKIS
mmetsp:Transcript_29375/g.41897  ORF Transcript_29375/g.41897 Transcript_29375/m.41897 type:complete len:232 (-) Transcript_29375:116-811(-)